MSESRPPDLAANTIQALRLSLLDFAQQITAFYEERNR